ncbi:mobilization protein MobD-like protein (plasmid) [Stanieria sp. NIES-3757]|nr:mobilization protein MobD-like protein [Stanieria sp. NIES-3757]
MATIYLIDGEKGGVGKSLFCRCLLHFLEQKKIAYKLIDTDPKPDVAQIYNGIKDIQFVASDEATVMYSQTAGEVDKIIDLAMKEDVIVNLPGKVHQQVKFWIEGNNLLDEDFIKESGVSFCKFFLSNGSDISLDLLEDSLQTYKGKLPHILVRNQGLKLDWSDITNSDRFLELKSKYQFLEIDFPGLRRTDIDFIDRKKQPFARVMAQLPLLARQRVKTFLSDTMAAIEGTGKFTTSPTPATANKK